jgi:hypothetical protein
MLQSRTIANYQLNSPGCISSGTMPQPAAKPLYFPGGLTTPTPGVRPINVSGIINSIILQFAFYILHFNFLILKSSNLQIFKSSNLHSLKLKNPSSTFFKILKKNADNADLQPRTRKENLI